ncbi:MAG: GNAT family N-acetyltransferase [Jatrophihabitantaceae bacterium]
MDTAELAAIRAVLGRAYADDPLTSWIFRAAGTRADSCAAWYGLFAEAYARSGHVTWLPADRAVCLWRGPDDAPLEWPPMPSVSGLLAALAGPEQAATVGDGLHLISDVVPPPPFVYVNFLAVDPDRQGAGSGARALRPALDAAGAAGVGVHLESTNPRNHTFYGRLGFVPGKQLAIADGPILTTMWRAP